MVEAEIHRLRGAAGRLVADVRSTIEAIAGALVKYRSLSSDEVYELATR